MKKFGLLIMAAFLLTACNSTTSPSFNSTNLENVDFSEIETMKKGKDCSSRFLIFGPMGARSLYNATKDGRIQKVKYIEHTYTGYPFKIFPLIGDKKCVVVYGE